jgi:hypothetical protein
MKYPATTTSYKGMVLTNPGGPGDSGVATVHRLGQNLSAVVGSNYDFVSFDPRGVGYSIPSGICIGSGASPLKRRRRSLIPSIDFPKEPELPEQFFQVAYENATVDRKLCQVEIGGPNDAGPHMTTSVNVKDMVLILDAFAASLDAVGVQNSSKFELLGL